MKTYLKLELKKAIFSWRTMISIIIVLASLAIPFLEELRFPYPGLDGVDYYIRISHFSYIGYIGPVVTALIYSTSIIKDKDKGFISKLMEIIDLKTYYKVKLTVNSIVTFIVFAVCHGFMIVWLIMMHGVKAPSADRVNISAFPSIYDHSKIIYIIIILLIVSLSSAAFSTFIFGITTATESRLIAYIVPIFYVILTGVFFSALSLNTVVNFNIIYQFNLVIGNGAKVYNVLIYDLVLFIMGVALLYKFGYKRTSKLYSEN
ncbi:hypothetical protein [Clostridium folliculivorans]|uniref:hypothetical protein n=1 Tax=Clostridium folliculivorans TaxID=2886038 RepID=UPI0021C4BCEB|nr:hypothetical protein [Clostridium folliculivorans]GKU32324.1 hypothetical protein CFB3_44320 [Clostridium folliculivorans]